MIDTENALGEYGKRLDELFSYHAPVGDQPARYERLRAAAKAFAAEIVACAPNCADREFAIRLIRTATMTANAAIALEGKL